MSYDKQFLAEQVKNRREKKGWTQDDLAECAGVSKDTIVSLENERRGLTLNTVCDVSEALGCRLEELVHYGCRHAA